jgi:hypothetical protein
LNSRVNNQRRVKEIERQAIAFDTFGRVLSVLEPREFESCLLKHFG